MEIPLSAQRKLELNDITVRIRWTTQKVTNWREQLLDDTDASNARGNGIAISMIDSGCEHVGAVWLLLARGAYPTPADSNGVTLMSSEVWIQYHELVVRTHEEDVVEIGR